MVLDISEKAEIANQSAGKSDSKSVTWSGNFRFFNAANYRLIINGWHTFKRIRMSVSLA